MIINVTDLMRRFELAGFPLSYGGSENEGNNFVTVRRKTGRRLGQDVFDTQQVPSKTINYYHQHRASGKTIQLWIVEAQKKSDSDEWDTNFADTNQQISKTDMKYSNLVLVMEDPDAPDETDYPSFQVFYSDIHNLDPTKPFQGEPLKNFVDGVLLEWVERAIKTPYDQMAHWKSKNILDGPVPNPGGEENLPPHMRRTQSSRR